MTRVDGVQRELYAEILHNDGCRPQELILRRVAKFSGYLRQGGYDFTCVCPSVCLLTGLFKKKLLFKPLWSFMELLDIQGINRLHFYVLIRIWIRIQEFFEGILPFRFLAMVKGPQSQWWAIRQKQKTIRFYSIRFSTTNFPLLMLIELIVLLYHSCLPRHLTYYLWCMCYFLQNKFLVFNLSFVFIFVMIYVWFSY